MKKIFQIYFILLWGSFFSCNTEKKEQYIANAPKISLNYRVDSLFQIFQKDNVDAKIFAIYFDKKDMNESQITMVCSSYCNAFSDKEPLNSFVLKNGIPVLLYSGIEDFLKNDNNPIPLKKMDSTQYLTKSRAIVNTVDTTYIVDADGFPPFLCIKLKPTVNFALPK
jgi:hypothetical protein